MRKPCRSPAGKAFVRKVSKTVLELTKTCQSRAKSRSYYVSRHAIINVGNQPATVAVLWIAAYKYKMAAWGWKSDCFHQLSDKDYVLLNNGSFHSPLFQGVRFLNHIMEILMGNRICPDPVKIAARF